MTREFGELPEPEEDLLGIYRDSPEVEESREREAEERALVRQRFLIDLMQRDLFREWLMEQLVGWGTFENSFGAGPTGFPDPMATQFQLGQKAAGWHLWTIFDDVAPELASRMRRERYNAGVNRKSPLPATGPSEGQAPVEIPDA